MTVDGEKRFTTNMLHRFGPKESGSQSTVGDHDKVDELAAAITKAWAECGIALRPLIAGEDDGEKEGHYVLVLVEFFYFFVHLTNRFALTFLGGEDGRRFIKNLSPLLIDYAVKICFAHFDENYREHVRERLPVGIAEREASYSEGTVRPPEQGVADNRVWIVTMLARHVNMKSGKPPRDPAIIREVIKAVVDQVEALNLERQISTFKRTDRTM